MLSYNHEKYVVQAIESIIAQTYKNWELIIVDNASTDTTHQIIKKYAQQYKQIKAFFLDYNSYVSYGINYAIKQSTGEYVAILSADDYFQANKLENQLNYMLVDSKVISFTWINTVNDFGEPIEHSLNDLFNQNFTTNDELLEFFIKRGNTLCAVTPLIQKCVLDDIGLHDNRLLQMQDFDLWLRIAKKYTIHILSEKLTNYRIRDDGGNLSINPNVSHHLRSSFEPLHFVRHIFDFNPALLIKIIKRLNKNLTHNEIEFELLYKYLFEFYLKNGNVAYAAAVLFALFDNLGSNFEFPSSKYEIFLELYSKFDLFNLYNMRDAKIGLFNIVGDIETEMFRLPIFPNQNTYVFDLDENIKIKKIKIKLNFPCQIILNTSYILTTDQTKVFLEPNKSNADEKNNNGFFFYNVEPFLIYNLDETCNTKVSKFVIEFRSTVLKTHMIFNKMQELQNEAVELRNQLDMLLDSVSWSITKPVRWIKNKLYKTH
jgi:glycosyltransferase involved in cell wall biosynthesis